MNDSIWTSTSIDELWDYDDPATSERKFREAVTSGAGDEARTQVARALGLQRKFDRANAELDEIELESASPIVRIRCSLERGRILNSSKRPIEALPHFEKALQMAEEGGFPFYAVDAAHMLAIASTKEASINWNLKAIEMIEASTDERTKKWLGSLLNNTAWSLHDAQRYPEALVLFERALEFRRTQGQEKPIQIAQWCIGRCMRSLGRIDDALAIQWALLGDRTEDGYINEEIGECLLLKGDVEAAKMHFSRAYKILSEDPWLADQQPSRLLRMKRISEGTE